MYYAYTTRCGLQLHYRLTRSARRSIGLYMKPQGLEIRAPQRLGQQKIEQAIEAKSSWIKKHLDQLNQRQQWWLPAEEVWRIGGAFPYMGEPIRIQTGTVKKPQPVFDADKQRITTLLLPPTEGCQAVHEWCQRWLRSQAREHLERRLQLFAESTDLQYRRFTLGWSKKVWGWCKSDGSIMLNWRLIHYPQRLIDYVVAHELSHLLHMHHGPEFWAQLALIYPDYLAAKQALQRYHPACIPNFLLQE